MKHLRIPLLSLLVLAVIGVTAALAVSDTYESVSFHPFTMDPDNNTCVDWPEESTKNCDPVNLVFPEATWQQVREALQAEGWTSGSGSTQWLHFNDATLVPQDEQIVLQEGFFHRYHLRLWRVPGSNPPVTLGAAHHEEGLFTHTIDMAWEDAEAFVAGQLCDSGSSCGSTGDLTQQLNIQSLDPDGDPGTWRGWANDGSATVFCGADSDGDGLGNACDPDDDDDSLGIGDAFGLFFRDDVELFLGTLPLVACAATAAPNDEDPDAVGPDWDDSQDVDGSDLFLFAERFGTELGVAPPVGKLPYIERFDIYPTAASLNKIDGSDLFVLATYFGDSCP